ncbi:MAG: hypothetical protein RR054_02120 [Clostridia bacterium]
MNIQEFLQKYSFSSQFDMMTMANIFIGEMERGLDGKAKSLKMIPTYISNGNNPKYDEECVIVDAGGSNLRVANAHFTLNGCEISNFKSCRMPGVDKQMSSDEFYGAIANFMKEALINGRNIGFCFSYPVVMDKSVDGKLIAFTKEVKVPTAIGKKVGECTLKAIGKFDDKDRRIVILNDSVATLLGGRGLNLDKSFDSYIGFIYGTGVNACYIEESKNIGKINDSVEDTMIINIESGNFDKFPRSEFDKKVMNSTVTGEDYAFEKMAAGRYISEIICEAVLQASRDGVISTSLSKDSFKFINTRIISDFLISIENDNNKLANILKTYNDRLTVAIIANVVIERAARMCVIMLSAIILKTNKGINAPVAIVAEGTTFNKLYGFRQAFDAIMDEFLVKTLHRNYVVIQGDGLNNVGSALAILSRK